MFMTKTPTSFLRASTAVSWLFIAQMYCAINDIGEIKNWQDLFDRLSAKLHGVCLTKVSVKQVRLECLHI